MATVQEDRLSIRAMEPADLPSAHALSKAERWPHRLEDWQMLLSLGHGIVAIVGGEVIATAMWFPAGPGRATIGMVIVSQNFRGAGIGRIVMEAVLMRAETETLALNATTAGVPLYRKLGFNGVGEIVQHQGAAFTVPMATLGAGERIRPIGARDHAPIKTLVEQSSGLDRSAALDELLTNASAVGLDRDGELVGVACFRRFGHGYSVGPVIAPSQAGAKALISHWLGSRAGEFTRLDIPAECGLSDWLEELGIARVDGVVSMVRGAPLPPPVGEQRCFGILSQALG